MALKRTDNFADIPLYYDRFKNGAYGNEAVKFRPYVDAKFLPQCNSCFEDMQKVFSKNGFGFSQIWSGGVGRSGTGRSYHHANRAFDLDGLVFNSKPMWVADTFPERPFIYLAIEACLRMHFGTVLNHDYNADHRDHFHFDNGTAVKFKRDARSHVLFLQHALVKLFNLSIGGSGFDGVFGGDTEAAMRVALKRLGIGGLSDRKNWLKFLAACAEEALDLENSILTLDAAE